MILNGSDLAWTQRADGEYHSENGKWKVTGQGRAWYVHREDELWGQWDKDGYGKNYAPFESLWEAVATIDEYECRGFALHMSRPSTGRRLSDSCRELLCKSLAKE